MIRVSLALTSAALLVGCGSTSSAADTDASTSDAGNSDATSGSVAGIELLSKLAGLWSGPATDTRLGSFPLTTMDFRAAGDSVLFGRVDLDSENSLRFAFAGEVHGAERVLVFRNGGLFQGMSRDTRTKLMETDGQNYRFCAIDGGCTYTETKLKFASDTSLEMQVFVKGALHEKWSATRVETRTLPEGFPTRTDLPGDAEFPVMPSAEIKVKWATALSAPTDVWTILSTTSCFPSGACQFSRWIKGRAPVGATELKIRLDQIHAGTYNVLGVVDSNNNLATTRFPDRGDLLSVPSLSLDVTSGVTSGDVSANFPFP